MRYFCELAYNGTRYHGWQKQPNALSVQESLELAFSTILGNEIELVGCGRTDTGVHATQYFSHFDYHGKFPKSFLVRINKFLPADIAIKNIFQVSDEAHARFDAKLRSYEYHIVFNKEVFHNETAWHYPFKNKIDFDKLQAAAGLLLRFQAFYPFCKTHHDAQTMKCAIGQSEWDIRNIEHGMVYHISSNRFLRGMVRLIVGMTLNVAIGKLSLSDVESALTSQTPLLKSWSVPAVGLFLTRVVY